MRLTIVALSLLLSTPLWAAEPRNSITCGAPVKIGDSAKSLKARFGKQAVIKTLPSAEGEMYKALVLFPKDKTRSVIVSFTDEAMTHVASVVANGDGTGLSVMGIAMGTGIAQIKTANGRPFDISGFDWDYGGFVTEWHGGSLGKDMAGGCSVSARFASDDPKLPISMSGDGVTLSSDDPRLLEFKAYIQMLGLNYP